MKIKKVSEIEAFRAGDDTLIREVLHPKNDGPALGYSLALASLEPGEASRPHVLRESSEVYYLLRGQGRVFVDEESAAVGPGEVVFIPAGAKQSIRNEGEDTLVFLCVVAPPWSEKQEVIDP